MLKSCPKKLARIKSPVTSTPTQHRVARANHVLRQPVIPSPPPPPPPCPLGVHQCMLFPKVLWPAVIQESVGGPPANVWRLRYLGPLSNKRASTVVDLTAPNTSAKQAGSAGPVVSEVDVSRLLPFPGKQRLSVVAGKNDSSRRSSSVDVLVKETCSDPNKVTAKKYLFYSRFTCDIIVRRGSFIRGVFMAKFCFLRSGT